MIDVPTYVGAVSPNEKATLRDFARCSVREIWFGRKFPKVSDRGDRVYFRQVEDVLFVGQNSVLIFSRPVTLRSGYEEFIVGVGRSDPGSKSLSSQWELISTHGSNMPVATFGRIAFAAPKEIFLVRKVLRLRDSGDNIVAKHLLDVGVHFRAADSGELLILTHRTLACVLEITDQPDAISRELADVELIQL